MGSDPKNIDSILSEAVEIESATERSAFLDEACGDDSQLRQRLDKLVADHFRAGDAFLEEPPTAFCATLDQPITEKPGTQIGPYKLLQQIGEGGMGVVYMAEQKEPVKRRVALKIIKPGMDTRQVIARFEAERQALAMMDHPNIAKALDAGTTESGRPYFVMELVKGVPITEFCDEHQLTPRERLELFLPVCHAIQHAHQKGIIHRDIKPSNVLVCHYDDRPMPKIIDFGVAKAIEHRLTEKTVFTEFGQVVGTIDYMSPEQAKLSQLDIDTRSDIYSLGVVLYELLAGETPFDRQRLRSAAFDELLRIIREEEPPTPSMRLSGSQSLPSIATNRHTEPSKLGTLVRGELDWIVMKALEKDRSRRYATATSFSADIERYLRDEPVQACPPSASYRFKKFARRNSAALVTVALVVISLMVGTGISIWQAIRATEAERLAQGRLEAIGEQQQQTEAQRQRAEANLQLALETLEQIYLPLAEDEFSESTKLSDRDRQFLQQALPFYEQLAAQKVDDPQMRDVKAQAYLRVGDIYRNLRTDPKEKNEPAEAALRQGITLFQQLTEEFPGNLEYQQKLAQNHRSLGALLNPRRRPEAMQAYQTAVRIFKPVIARSNNAWDYALRGLCYRELTRYAEALDDYRKAVELDPNNAQFHYVLSGLYTDIRLRNLELALTHAEQAVELEPDTARYQSKLAFAYQRLGNLPAAREACDKALSLDATLAETNLQMAVILRLQGDCDQALVFAEKVLRTHEPDHTAFVTRGQIFADLGRHQEALADFSQSVALAPTNYYVYRGRAQIFVHLGRFEEALADYAKAISLAPETVPQLNNTTYELVRYPAGWEPQMLEPAVTCLRRAIELEPENHACWNTLGIAHYRAGNWQESIAALNRSESFGPGKAFGFNGFFLAMAHWQLGQQEAARQWYDRSVAWMRNYTRMDKKELVRFRAEAEELMGIETQEKHESPVSQHGSGALESEATSKRAAAPKAR